MLPRQLLEEAEEESDLAKFLRRPLPVEVVSFRRGGQTQQCRVTVLRLRDLNQAREVAQRWAEERKFNAEKVAGPGLSAIVQDLTACEMLARACHGAAPIPGTEDAAAPAYPRVFRDGLHVCELLTREELEGLFAAYLRVQQAAGPDAPRTMTSEEAAEAARRMRDETAR